MTDVATEITRIKKYFFIINIVELDLYMILLTINDKYGLTLKSLNSDDCDRTNAFYSGFCYLCSQKLETVCDLPPGNGFATHRL